VSRASTERDRARSVDIPRPALSGIGGRARPKAPPRRGAGGEWRKVDRDALDTRRSARSVRPRV